MSRLSENWPRATLLTLLTVLASTLAMGGFSVDEDPRETNADPGDLFFNLSPPTCDMDDGDGSCAGVPSLNVPNPFPAQDPTFDLDAFAIEDPLYVCPEPLGWPNGILFSIDDRDPGPGVGTPDFDTEIFWYNHCNLPPYASGSFHTTITEGALGLGANPPPTSVDDDVDAYETRPAGFHYNAGFNIMFSPDTPSNGGLTPINPPTFGPEAYIWVVNIAAPVPVELYSPLDLGVNAPEDCDIDGIAIILDQDGAEVILYTVDADHDCGGMDPGDIFATDRAGGRWLFADDVNDLRIGDQYDIDALSVNTGGNFDVTDPFDPQDPDEPVFKADWPNYAPSGMPDFSQDHSHRYWPPTILDGSPINTSHWCGPTAVADSLWWFDSEMECESDLTFGVGSEIEINDFCNLANTLGERPNVTAGFGAALDADWYVFELPYKPYRTCRVTISTCARRKAGDADTFLSLYNDCDTSGVPGTPVGLIASNDNGCLPDLQSEIVVDLPGGDRYWVEVAPPPTGPGAGADYTLSLGIDCYPMVKRYPGDITVLPLIPSTPDDHSEWNPVRLMPDLANCMNTDDVWATGSGHKGTKVPDMKTCITNRLNSTGLAPMYEAVNDVAGPPFHTPDDPDDDEVAEEVMRSEDVVLLLGFWWHNLQTDQWNRCGGHYVTAAGVDLSPNNETVWLSDPAINNAETGALLGRVRGPDHTDHAPALNPPPDHDDTQNISHDLYAVGPRQIPATIPVASRWSIPTYATNGLPTTCIDVERWCMDDVADPGRWRQNPPEPPILQDDCYDPDFPVSVEVEWMIDVSPKQTPICIFLANSDVWPDNLRIDKRACSAATEIQQKDLIRGKLCNLRFPPIGPGATVDLGHVQCLYDDSPRTEFDELSPDDTRCMGGWFYLMRLMGDVNYGQAYPGAEVRIPSSGGCP